MKTTQNETIKRLLTEAITLAADAIDLADAYADGDSETADQLAKELHKLELEAGREIQTPDATPELLAALQALTATARTFRNVPKEEHEWGPLDDEAIEAAFAAIAKATGEEVV